jgi:hypothetical protein
MTRPVVRAGLAGAFVCAFNGLCAFVLPTILPYWRPVWLIAPLVGVDVAPRSAEALPGIALLIGLGATLLVTVTFYLDHCVINQPAWALFLGWGTLLGGTVTSIMQAIVHSSHTLFIDVNNGLWLLGTVEMTAASLVVVLSWLRAPDMFSPHLRRWMVIAWIASLVAVDIFGTRIGISSTMGFFLSMIISVMVLIGGSSIVSRSESRPVPTPSIPVAGSTASHSPVTRAGTFHKR